VTGENLSLRKEQETHEGLESLRVV